MKTVKEYTTVRLQKKHVSALRMIKAKNSLKNLQKTVEHLLHNELQNTELYSFVGYTDFKQDNQLELFSEDPEIKQAI